MLIDNKYGLGQIVYVITEGDQNPWIITCILVRERESISYSVSSGIENATFYEYELAPEKDIAFSTGGGISTR